MHIWNDVAVSYFYNICGWGFTGNFSSANKIYRGRGVFLFLDSLQKSAGEEGKQPESRNLPVKIYSLPLCKGRVPALLNSRKVHTKYDLESFFVHSLCLDTGLQHMSSKCWSFVKSSYVKLVILRVKGGEKAGPEAPGLEWLKY